MVRNRAFKGRNLSMEGTKILWVQQILDQEYVRLGSVLDKMSLMELVKRSEIELSKNSAFSLLPLRIFDALYYFKFERYGQSQFFKFQP